MIALIEDDEGAYVLFDSSELEVYFAVPNTRPSGDSYILNLPLYTVCDVSAPTCLNAENPKYLLMHYLNHHLTLDILLFEYHIHGLFESEIIHL